MADGAIEKAMRINDNRTEHDLMAPPSVNCRGLYRRGARSISEADDQAGGDVVLLLTRFRREAGKLPFI
jgi:hypothetical protein